jgi:hypothetical protein
MSSFKQGFLDQMDPVAEIFARPPKKEVAGDKASTGKERFEISALPSRDSKQTNWNYQIIRHEGESRMLVNLEDRTYQWQLPKDFSNFPSGDNGVSARRLTDIDSHYAKEMVGKSKVLSKGRLQVHRSGPSSLYATIQDGKTNPTFDLSHDKNNSWNLKARTRPVKADPARTLTDAATAKSAGMKDYLSGVWKDIKKTHFQGGRHPAEAP